MWEAVPQDCHKLLQLLRVSRHESDCLGHSLNFVSAFRLGVDVKSEIHSMAYFNNHLMFSLGTNVSLHKCITPTESLSSLSRRHMFVGPAQPQFLLTVIDFFSIFVFHYSTLPLGYRYVLFGYGLRSTPPSFQVAS